MPAIRPRNANPVAICRAARLRLVLPTRYQTTSATTPTMTICQKIARNRGSDQEIRSAFFGAARAPIIRGSAVAPDMVGRVPLRVPHGMALQVRCRKARAGSLPGRERYFIWTVRLSGVQVDVLSLRQPVEVRNAASRTGQRGVPHRPFSGSAGRIAGRPWSRCC